MKKQFLHEAHNLQDKAKKTEYQERFTEEGNSFDRGGIANRPHFQFRGANLHIHLRQIATEEKRMFIDRLQRHFRFVYDGNVGTVSRLSKNPAFAKDLEYRFDLTKGSILRATQYQWVPHPNKNRQIRLIQFRSFLELSAECQGITVIDVFAFLPEVISKPAQ